MNFRRHLPLAMVAALAVIVAGLWAGATVLMPQSATHSTGTALIGGPFTLVDDTGARVTQASLAGEPSVMYFGYTYCPEVCPTTLADLTRWIGKLGPDADRLNYVFVTVDPQRDTPKVMREYLTSFDHRIRGYTGTPAQIAAIAKAYRVYYKRIPQQDGSYLMDHTAMIYLMGPDNTFVGTIAYQETDASAIAKLKRLAGMVGVGSRG